MWGDDGGNGGNGGKGGNGGNGGDYDEMVGNGVTHFASTGEKPLSHSHVESYETPYDKEND